MMRIAMTEEIPEREARAFDTDDGRTIFITQRDGAYYAYNNLCPHLQTELEFLENQFLDQTVNIFNAQPMARSFWLKQVNVFLDLAKGNHWKK